MEGEFPRKCRIIFSGTSHLRKELTWSQTCVCLKMCVAVYMCNVCIEATRYMVVFVHNEMMIDIWLFLYMFLYIMKLCAFLLQST